MWVCSDIRELVADVVHVKRESGVPDPDLIPLAQWKIKSSAHESSTVSSKLRDEIDKMKRYIILSLNIRGGAFCNTIFFAVMQ